MKASEILYPFDEELASKIANVLGSSSAAAQALTALAKRREAGDEDVYLWCASSTLVVGPYIEPSEQEGPLMLVKPDGANR